MEKKGLTKGIFVLGLTVTILIATALSAGISTQLSIAPQGLKGDTGDTGPQGAQGPAGETGATGASGPAGLQGATGAAGATGATGATGPQGLQGAQASSSPNYDSGWIDITNKTGQFLTLQHNLNSSDVSVEIYGKTTATGGTHQKYLGLTAEVPGWNRTFGTTANEYGYSLVKTSDDGYAIAGITYASGASTPDAWLLRVDLNGNLIWNKTFGGPAADYPYSIAQTSDGGFALAGYTKSFGAGSSDFWLIKTDSSGNAQWNKTYGGLVDDVAECLVQTADGGYAMIGGTSPTYFVNGAGTCDLMLVKTDASGIMQWNKIYAAETYGPYLNTSGGNLGFTVIQTNDGGYILGSAATLVSGAGAHDFVLSKTDSLGNVQWFKTYGGNSTDILRALITTKDGGYAMAGITSSFGSGGNDVWLVKVNATGIMQWNKTYGGSLNDMVFQNNFVQSSDGGYAIVAYTMSFGVGNNDVWLVKTDSYGNMQWSKTYGGIGSDNGMAMVQTKDGAYSLLGHTNSFGAGGYDVYLIKASVEGESGLAWTDSTVNIITLYRGANDVYWNYVRVRIWKIS